jgi:hypothetical protein
MSTPEDYLGRVRAIAWAASDYVSAEGLHEVQRLVDHGEPAEGMRSLAWAIVNEKRRVPRTLIGDIREHAAGLVDDEAMPSNLDEFATDDAPAS